MLVPWRTLLFVDPVFNIIVLPSQFNFYPSIEELLIKTLQLRQPRPKREQQNAEFCKTSREMYPMKGLVKRRSVE